jgi:hypothetical protein
MKTHNMVVGLPKLFPHDGVYKGCVLGKNHRAPFNSSKYLRAQNLLEMVHNDLCCINLPSLAGVSYIFTFIDDLSHLTWVYFLKKKNHVVEKFKGFKALAEK